jgi:ABC-type methionine transport system permease subunit
MYIAYIIAAMIAVVLSLPFWIWLIVIVYPASLIINRNINNDGNNRD